MQYTADSLSESYRHLVRYCALAALVVHTVFIGLFVVYDVPVMAALNVLSVATHAYAYWQSRPHGNMRHAGNAVGLEVSLHAIAATLTIGWESGFHYLMIPIVPIAMLSTSLPYRKRLAISASAAATYIALLYWSHHYTTLYTMPENILQPMQYGCVITLLLAFIAMARRYRQVLTHAQADLAREASTDPLTGALNRRRLSQLATQLPADSQGALLLCDLDYFKRINDRHGHEAGDAVLQAFYRQLLAHTRRDDHVCRWGGEEFLVLLPHTTPEVARNVAQRICASVAQTPVALSKETALQITVTIGIATLQPGESLQSAVQRADDALYIGKTAGRNRVQTSDSPADATAAAT